MTHFDLAPMFRPSASVGNLWRFFDDSDPWERAPHYDVAHLEDGKYRITLSVPGFAEEELLVETNQNLLTISGKREVSEKESPESSKAEAQEKGARYLYRSIERRSFAKSFRLADHIRVVNANLQNGLLSIDLERDIPEEMKPQRIAISVQ